MRRYRNTLTALLAAVVFAPGASVLSAQGMPLMAEHAEIGTLERVTKTGFDLEVTIELPKDAWGEEFVHRTYETGVSTQVEGLGSIMDVEDIPPAATGSIVVVTFVRDGSDLVAKSIRFTGDREILVTQGTIERVDHEDRMLVLRDLEGQRERFNLDFGYGAAIDSDRGLISSSQLDAGHEYTVYYAEPPVLETSNRDADVRIARVLTETN